MPVPVAARSRRRSAAARLLRLWVRNPPVAWMSVCCECCVLSGRGLCDKLTTRPEESYRLWCVAVCDIETSSMRSQTWSTQLLNILGQIAIYTAKKKKNLKQMCRIHRPQNFIMRSTHVLMWDISLSLLDLILLWNKSCEVKYREYFTSLPFPTLKNLPIKKDDGVWHPLRTNMSDLDFEYGDRPHLKSIKKFSFVPQWKHTTSML